MDAVLRTETHLSLVESTADLKDYHICSTDPK